jgi:hypothetical protein
MPVSARTTQSPTAAADAHSACDIRLPETFRPAALLPISVRAGVAVADMVRLILSLGGIGYHVPGSNWDTTDVVTRLGARGVPMSFRGC